MDNLPDMTPGQISVQKTFPSQDGFINSGSQGAVLREMNDFIRLQGATPADRSSTALSSDIHVLDTPGFISQS